MDHEEAKQLAQRAIEFLETGNLPSDAFTEDFFADLCVPSWRFQLQGVEDIAKWFASEHPNGSRVTSWRADATAAGFVLEVHQEIELEGATHHSISLNRFEVRDGRIAEWALFCTGVWDEETRSRQRREAPMLRP